MRFTSINDYIFIWNGLGSRTLIPVLKKNNRRDLCFFNLCKCWIAFFSSDFWFFASLFIKGCNYSMINFISYRESEILISDTTNLPLISSFFNLSFCDEFYSYIIIIYWALFYISSYSSSESISICSSYSSRCF